MYLFLFRKHYFWLWTLTYYTWTWTPRTLVFSWNLNFSNAFTLSHNKLVNTSLPLTISLYESYS